jgi:hypothetical protein
MLVTWSAGILQVCHTTRLWCWLMPLSLLHVCHNLLRGLQHLGLQYQNMLKCWGWRRIVGSIVVFICGTIASVSHLMIGKRFEIEIDKEKIDVRIPNYMHHGITMIEILFI